VAARASAMETANKRIDVFMAPVSTATFAQQSKTESRLESARLEERKAIFSEVMKNMTGGVLFCVVALAASGVNGGQLGTGVAGVDVIVKQVSNRRDVTNAWGVFAFEALPAGSYTLNFRARPAKDVRSMTRDKLIVATTYSIKIEGTKNPINRSGLTTDKLLAGVDIPVQVRAGAKIRGEVLSGTRKNMIWIPKTPGTNIPGHWAEEGSSEAASLFHTEVYGPRDWQNAHR
jgi:hypothetical protein